ncbi:DNA-directed RNA polymerase subunit D [Candidatus Pacearchaeota archaeon]|nr:DNA-directed RNA polymerase subunit D [Candidatus Pacearchaeota archaeon]
MKIIEKNKSKIVFTLDIDASLANAIRRSINEIPILAVDEVEFYKNDSVLNDQIIAHRIGLLPLKRVNVKDSNPLQLKLSVKGPKTVYASELGSQIVYPDMPIIVLEKGQELEFVAYARMGKGIEHIKYSPGHAYYRHLYDIDIKKNVDKIKVFLEDKRAMLIEKQEKETYRYDLAESMLDALKEEFKDSVDIKESGDIIFFIESFGQIDADKILLEAIDVLRENLQDIGKA